jgi:hypothetical protein
MLVHHEAARLEPLSGIAFSPVPTGSARADLTLSFYEPPGPGPVDCLLHYATGLFDRATIDSLTTAFIAILNTAVIDPSRPLSALLPERTPTR